MTTKPRRDWYLCFLSQVDQSKIGLAKAILDRIDGYGTEYDYDEDRDAADFSDAIHELARYHGWTVTP